MKNLPIRAWAGPKISATQGMQAALSQTSPVKASTSMGMALVNRTTSSKYERSIRPLMCRSDQWQTDSPSNFSGKSGTSISKSAKCNCQSWLNGIRENSRVRGPRAGELPSWRATSTTRQGPRRT